MSKFYQPTGLFSGGDILITLAAVGVISSVLAVPYALILWYCPIVYLAVFLPLGYAKLTALACGFAVRRGKLRSPHVASAVGGIGCLMGWYMSWAAWAVMVKNIYEQGSFNIIVKSVPVVETSLPFFQPFAQALSPLEIFRLIQDVGPWGLWSVEGYVVSGVLLYVTWGLEAIVFIFFASRFFASYGSEPFSERTYKWFPKQVLSVPLSLPPKMKLADVYKAIKVGQLGALLDAHEEKSPEANSYLKVILYYLPKAEEAYATVYGYELKSNNSHQKTLLAKYLKMPESLGKLLNQKFH
jgi:hypothetical protein